MAFQPSKWIEINPEGGVARPAPAAAGKTFFVHIGSTGCTGNPVTGETVSCARPNRMDVEFATFDPARQKVVLDVAQPGSYAFVLDTSNPDQPLLSVQPAL